MKDTSLVSSSSSSASVENIDGKQQPLVPVSPQAVGSLRTISDAVVVPQDLCFLSPLTRDAASKEYLEFLVELNQSSALGLTASELHSLLTVSTNVLLKGPDTSVVKQTLVTSGCSQCCLKRSAERQAQCICHLNSGGTSSAQFEQSVSTRSVGEGPGAKSRKKDATTSAIASFSHSSRNKSKEERPRRSECEGCRTLSLVISQKFSASRKWSNALTCTHELFPHYEPQDEHDTTMQTQVETKHDNSKGGAAPSDTSLSDHCAHFKCRVICLSEREHLILCNYEKATESFGKLNKKALQHGKRLQLFLLRRKPEVHVNSEGFNNGTLELLKEIRRATLWWARHRNNRVGAKRESDLPDSTKATLKSTIIHGSSPNRSLVVPNATTPADCVGKLCTDYPDCGNSLMNDEKTFCLPVLVQPRQKHSILVAYEKEKKIVEQLKALFKFENCRISLLRRKPVFHVSGSKPGSVTVFMIKQLIQRASSEQAIGKWLIERGVLPVVSNPRVPADGDSAKAKSLKSSGSKAREGFEEKRILPSSISHGPRTILCPSRFCTNTKRPEEVEGIPGIFFYRTCHRVEFSAIAQHDLFLRYNRSCWLDFKLAEISKKFGEVRVCLLKEQAEFHVYDPKDQCPSLFNDLKDLISLCESEFDIPEYADRLVKNMLNPWVCSNYPDCTNSNKTDNEFKFFPYNVPRCHTVLIPPELQRFLLYYPSYRGKLVSEFFSLAPDLGAHQLRICLLKNTNAVHVRCSKRGLADPCCNVIQNFFMTYTSVEQVQTRLGSQETTSAIKFHEVQQSSTTVWMCNNYPDCTNSRLGETDDGNRCLLVQIRRWKLEKTIEFGFKQQLEAYFQSCVEPENRGGVRVCLLKNRNEFHIRAHWYHQERIQREITAMFNDVDTALDLRIKLSKLHWE